MAKLQTLKPRLSAAPIRQLRVLSTKDNRITGSRLQARRFKLWKGNPHCAQCGRLVDYPYGFELDHKVALMHGGEDTEENCQILCSDYYGVKGCHSKKTKADLSGSAT